MQYAGNVAALSSLNATLFKEKTKGRLMDNSVVTSLVKLLCERNTYN
jgi:hypothetical protein